MADKLDKIKVVTPPFRMEYPNLVTPRAYQGKEKAGKDYSVGMIFAPADMEKFRIKAEDGSFQTVGIVDLCKKLAASKWPGKDVKDIFIQNGKSTWPIKKGDAIIAEAKAKNKKKIPDYLEGMFRIRAKTGEEYAPRLTYILDGELITIDRDDEKLKKKAMGLFVGGHYAIAELTLVPSTVDDKNYISFYLNGVRWRKEGERFGGESLMDQMEGVDGGEGDVDPTDASMDDL